MRTQLTEAEFVRKIRCDGTSIMILGVCTAAKSEKHAAIGKAQRKITVYYRIDGGPSDENVLITN